MKEKPGEIIPLCWEGNPEAYYVKGHCMLEDAIKTVCCEEGINSDSVHASHMWAKWCRASEDDGLPDGVTLVFRTVSRERKGWFKVTEVKSS